MRRLADYVIFVITTIVTIVTFIGFLTSKQLEAWTKAHSEAIFYGLVFFFMATGASLNYLLEERKKYGRLEKATAQLKPSEYDRKLFQDFKKMLPPGGPIIKWLKDDFTPNAYLKANYKVIEATLEAMILQSPGFDNPEARTGCDQLQGAMQKFVHATGQYMRNDPANPWLRIRPELDGKGSDNAVGEIIVIHRELIEKYENFLNLAHKNKIDE